ncbi:hypothetical protein GPALN_015001 [Globodera pallida]|nr:hypothetical protein GPALN_015001 [Globodera pallida]
MDEFLTSKCITNESDFMKMSGDEKSNWEKELKQFILKLKCSELETLFSQIDIKIDPMEIDDQQQLSTMSAITFMEILLNKMLEKLPKKVPKTKQHRLNVEQNVFAIDEFVNNLNQEQNQLLWKFDKVAKIYVDFESSYTYWFDLEEYFDVNISWHEPDENIAAWKMDVPEQRFVQSLLDYDRGDNNKMEMVLKNGFKDLLLTFQREENLCEIEIPSAIEKMKVEIDQQIKRLNKFARIQSE